MIYKLTSRSLVDANIFCRSAFVVGGAPGAGGEMEKVTWVFQPDGRFAASPCVSPTGKRNPIWGPPPSTCDISDRA